MKHLPGIAAFDKTHHLTSKLLERMKYEGGRMKCFSVAASAAEDYLKKC